MDQALDDTTEISFTWAKMHIRDWIKGTEGFRLELEGAYWRFCSRLYENGRPLLDDDRLMSTKMALSLRVWKRIKAELMEIGKIVCRNGYLTNPRFEKERAERAETLKKQSQAAVEMHERRRAEKPASDEVSPKFGRNLPQTLGKKPEKANKINQPDLPEHGHLKSKIEKEESSLRSDSPAAPSAEPVAASDLALEDPGWILFNKAAPQIAQRTGKPERAVKALIGKWRKVIADEELLKIARDAYRAADPVSYISAIVRQHEQEILHSVRRENGRLVVVNGFKAELEGILKGQDFDRALIKIDGKIGGHVIGTDLKRRVRMLAVELVEQHERGGKARPHWQKTEDEKLDALLEY